MRADGKKSASDGGRVSGVIPQVEESKLKIENEVFIVILRLASESPVNIHVFRACAQRLTQWVWQGGQEPACSKTLTLA